MPEIFRPEEKGAPSFDTAICYLIAYEPEEGNTPFRGFQFVPLKNSGILQAVAALPSDVRQFACDAGFSVSYRAIGLQPLRVAFCPVRRLGDVLRALDPQFPVVFARPDLEPAVFEALRKGRAGRAVLLLTASFAETGFSHLDETIRPLVRWVGRYVKEQAAELAQCGDKNVAAAFEALRLAEEPRRTGPAARWEGVPVLRVLPSDTVLYTLGYEIARGPELKSWENKPYFEAMARSATEVQRERARLFAARKGPLIRIQNDVLLAAPTAYGELRARGDAASKWAQAVGAPLQREELARFVEILKRQQRFLFGGQMTKAESDFLRTGTGATLLWVHAAEMRAMTAYCSTLAADSQAPVLQWAPDLAEVSEPLAEFSAYYRDNAAGAVIATSGPSAGRIDGGSNREVMKRFGAVQDKLRGATPPEYLDLLRDPGSAKIVADLPIEWLDVDGLPLMFARETSRLPMTPGMLMHALPNPGTLFLPNKACRKALVLTAFDVENGEQSDVLEALDELEFDVLDVQVKTVRTEKDVIEALNAFDGPLVIFDAHGGASDNLFGELALSDGSFSPFRAFVTTSEGMWQRKLDVRVPPVVILSACDTLAIDSPSGSAASGFLLGGASAVLASFLPVLFGPSGRFIARLLRRYDEFLSKLAARSHPVRWRQLVWDTQRLVYLTELYHIVCWGVGGELSVDDFVPYALQTSEVINGEDPRFPGGRAWFDKAIELLGETFSVPSERILAVLRERGLFCDTMNYVQVGFPERVVIMTEPFGQLLPALKQLQWQEAMGSGAR